MSEQPRAVSMLWALCPVVCLTACANTKVLEEPVPLEINNPLAVAGDERLAVSLDWIIVRNGPGAWAQDANWDEYLLRVQNLSDDTIRVTDVIVRDSLETLVENRGSHRGLVNGTKLASRRYGEEGLNVQAGLGGETLLAASAGVGYMSYNMTMTFLAVREAIGVTSGFLTAGMAGLFVVAPAMVVSGVQRNRNDRAIAREIGWRQTPLPAVLQPAEGRNMDFFFPVTPSPTEIEVTYFDADGEHKLIIDTRQALDGLHLREAD